MRSSGTPAGIALRSLVSVLVAGLAAACTSSPTASPSIPTAGPLTAPPIEASASPFASTQPTESSGPSAAPSPTVGIGTLDVLPPGAAVQVAVKELNLRRKPSTSARLITTLGRGDVLVITPNDSTSFGYGPVSRNGYSWYPVAVTGYRNGALPALPESPLGGAAGPLTFGWVAADNGSKPYVAPLPPRCPTTVDLESVQGMLAAERLACFGAPITLSGTFGCGGCGGEIFGTYKPVWLATPVELDFLSVNPAARLGPLALRFTPGGPARPAAGTRINVTIHIDDPRSTRCTMVNGEGATAVTVDKRTAVLYCRERLVVERFDNLGPDPSFPS